MTTLIDGVRQQREFMGAKLVRPAGYEGICPYANECSGAQDKATFEKHCLGGHDMYLCGRFGVRTLGKIVQSLNVRPGLDENDRRAA